MPWFAKYNADRRLMNAAGDTGGEAGGGAPAEKPQEGQADGESEGGDNGDGKGEGEKSDPAKKPEEVNKPSESEAKLLKEVMTRKQAQKDLEAQLKAFGDITPEQVRSLIDAENARKAEEADKEKANLEKRGEWDRLKEVMVTEHEKVLGTKDTRITELETTNATLQKQIEDMTVGANFSNSKFIGEEMLLTPSKARVVYGAHFDVKDGKVVGYDKPVGTSNRTMLVDGRGEPLGFEDAIKKLVDTDPERDSLIRSKAKPGASSTQPEGGPKNATVAKGLGRITAGLASEL